MTTINTLLRNKVERWEYDRCHVDVTVTLSNSEFEHFRRHLLQNHDFIINALSKLPVTNDNTRHCIMVLNDEADDGILVDPQGYSYARYSAYIPNAKQIIQTHYPSLDEFDDRMRRAIDKYVRLAIESQIDGKFTFDIQDVNREYDCENFNSDLFVDMIGECEEFIDIDYCGGEFTVTLNPDYLPEKDREIYYEEVKEKCARHALWMLDVAGGERADFTGRIINDMDFKGVDLSGAVFDKARFINCNFESACLMKTSMKNTKFESCNFSLATAEEAIAESAEFNKCDFSQADFIESNFKDAVFNVCKFDCISIENSLLLGTQFNATIPEADEVGRCYYTEEGFNSMSNNSLEQAPLS